MTDELYHYGVKGMKWGVRRYQNDDGSYTDKGKARRRIGGKKELTEYGKEYLTKDPNGNPKNDAIISAVPAAVPAYYGYKLARQSKMGRSKAALAGLGLGALSFGINMTSRKLGRKASMAIHDIVNRDPNGKFYKDRVGAYKINKDGSIAPNKKVSKVTRNVINDYNTMGDKDFFNKYKASRKTYLKRLSKHNDPYVHTKNSASYKAVKFIDKNKAAIPIGLIGAGSGYAGYNYSKLKAKTKYISDLLDVDTKYGKQYGTKAPFFATNISDVALKARADKNKAYSAFKSANKKAIAKGALIGVGAGLAAYGAYKGGKYLLNKRKNKKAVKHSERGNNMYYTYPDELYHYGVKGQRWGVRRYQNTDGSLTDAGRSHYGRGRGRRVGSYKSKYGYDEPETSPTFRTRKERDRFDARTDKALKIKRAAAIGAGVVGAGLGTAYLIKSGKGKAAINALKAGRLKRALGANYSYSNYAKDVARKNARLRRSLGVDESLYSRASGAVRGIGSKIGKVRGKVRNSATYAKANVSDAMRSLKNKSLRRSLGVDESLYSRASGAVRGLKGKIRNQATYAKANVGDTVRSLKKKRLRRALGANYSYSNYAKDVARKNARLRRALGV